MNTSLPDNELILALSKGDRRAYTQIYQQYALQLCYFVNSIIFNKEASEDIASETLIKAFDRQKDFMTPTELKNFLFKVAFNAALDYRKMEARYRERLHTYTNIKADAEPDIQESYIQSEAVMAVYRHLEYLPLQVKQVLRFSLFEGASIAEIAERMNITSKTVKNHKTKGLAMLRAALLKDELLSPRALVFALMYISTIS